MSIIYLSFIFVSADCFWDWNQCINKISSRNSDNQMCTKRLKTCIEITFRLEDNSVKIKTDFANQNLVIGEENENPNSVGVASSYTEGYRTNRYSETSSSPPIDIQRFSFQDPRTFSEEIRESTTGSVMSANSDEYSTTSENTTPETYLTPEINSYTHKSTDILTPSSFADQDNQSSTYPFNSINESLSPTKLMDESTDFLLSKEPVTLQHYDETPGYTSQDFTTTETYNMVGHTMPIKFSSTICSSSLDNYSRTEIDLSTSTINSNDIGTQNPLKVTSTEENFNMPSTTEGIDDYTTSQSIPSKKSSQSSTHHTKITKLMPLTSPTSVESSTKPTTTEHSTTVLTSTTTTSTLTTASKPKYQNVHIIEVG